MFAECGGKGQEGERREGTHPGRKAYSGVGGIKKTRGPVDCSFVRAQLYA